MPPPKQLCGLALTSLSNVVLPRLYLMHRSGLLAYLKPRTFRSFVRAALHASNWTMLPASSLSPCVQSIFKVERNHEVSVSGVWTAPASNHHTTVWQNEATSSPIA